MSQKHVKYFMVAGLFLAAVLLVVCSKASSETEGMSEENMIERGEFLVTLGGCNDCHTPKKFSEKGVELDGARILSGQPAAEKLPEIPAGLFTPTSGWGGLCNTHMTAWVGPWGVSFAANLTPDQVTGSGAWTESAFIQAMRTGKHLGSGRPILPPMPWQAIGTLSDQDLKCMFAYLQSIKPISNMVPQPMAPEH